MEPEELDMNLKVLARNPQEHAKTLKHSLEIHNYQELAWDSVMN